MSYAYAFHYLLAPSIGGERSLEYPSMANRASFIDTFGKLDLPKHGFADYKSEFVDRATKIPPRDGFVSASADHIAIALAPVMYERADTIVKTKAAEHASEPSAQLGIVRKFENGVPAREPRSLPDTVNAGWTFLHSQRPTFKENDRALIEWISELVLKSIEVLEFKSRTKNA